MAKIRTGFVSNSSSSSFLLFIKRSDETINSLDEYRESFKDEWGLDDEDVQNYMDKFSDKFQEMIDRNLGGVIIDIDNNCIEAATNIAHQLGGEVMDLEDY